MIPCIKNKCIRLPVCKSKRRIICKELMDWAEIADNKFAPQVGKTLPNTKSVSEKEW